MRRIPTLTPSLRSADLSSEDICLLQMALCEGGLRETAWDLWRESADFDTLTTASLLVPAASYGLDHPTSEPVARRMKGAFRKNWLLTQLVQKRVSSLLETIGNSGIDCRLGDDLSYALFYYPNSGMRPIYEVSLFCRSADRKDLSSEIERAGYVAANRKAWNLTDQASLRIREMDTMVFTGEQTTVAKSPIPILNATEQFWSTFRASRPTALLRFLDLGILLRDHGQNISWQHIEAQSRYYGQQGVLNDVLRFFVESFEIRLPQNRRDLITQSPERSESGNLFQRARGLAWAVRRGLRD